MKHEPTQSGFAKEGALDREPGGRGLSPRSPLALVGPAALAVKGGHRMVGPPPC